MNPHGVFGVVAIVVIGAGLIACGYILLLLTGYFDE